jgi:hypothetical protein
MTATPTRPSFARDFPREPGLDALVEAFARGNYARVRAEAVSLAASSGAEDVRRAAQELLARTKPDPMALGLLALTGALLVVLSTYWITYAAPPPRPAPVERVR